MITDRTRLEPLTQSETTSRVIGAAFEVHNTLGYGFLEKVYQRAMQVELIRRGSSAETESPIKVLYKNVVVGEYYADLVVDALRDRRNQSCEILQSGTRGTGPKRTESNRHESWSAGKLWT
ncbi:MAG TPA: GxxExxY protein [Terrimicrobiaceae bacterium]